jgi:hypothetical protein
MSAEFNAEYAANLRAKMIQFENEVAIIRMKYAILIGETAKSLVHTRSGQLKSSINCEVVGSKIVLSASTPYAAIEEARHPFLEPAYKMLAPSLEAELRGLQSKVFDL